MNARSRGFTLIELMVAMVVSAIVVLGIFAFSTIQQSTTGIHSRNVRVQQALEGAMWSVGGDVRAAGLGWTRFCTELRVWDFENSRRINPGAEDEPATTVFDANSGERYWVLRDGVQAFWDSNGSASLPGAGTSTDPGSAADAFDVIVAEPNYVGSPDVFTVFQPVVAGDTEVIVETGPALDAANAAQLAEMRQLFPPGTFIIMADVPAFPFRAEDQQQCPLLQVTGDVEPAADGIGQHWAIPIANTSGFNADLDELLNADPGLDEGPEDDWDPVTVNATGSSIIPLGRLRWSRYEIDYAIPELPYLVRYDLIGFIEDTDLGGLGAVDYPHCIAGECPMPQLHLPGSGSPPRAVAIGPMIEDMQVASGCDGYTAAGVDAVAPDVVIPYPDATFEEVGPAEGPFANLPNGSVDENSPDSSLRNADEWIGNALAEATAPDCVYYGTGEYDSAEWLAVEGSSAPPPPFRNSPQSLRVTLVASSEFVEEAGGLSTPNVQTIEDRPEVVSPVGTRQRFTLTETFTPENLRWRDPRIQ